MKISVYITSYNQAAYLREAIDSVLAQTRPADEIVIVDDASTDDSPALIRGYAAHHPGRIRAVLHPQNRGVAQVRVSALQAVTGDYVTYVDGDDRMLPAKLEREAAVLEQRSDVQLAFSNHFNMAADGQRLDTWVRAGETPPQGDIFAETFARDFPRRDIFRMEMARTDAVRRAGLHNPALAAFEDFDFRIRLTRLARAAYVDAPLFEIRRHGAGLSALASEHKLALLRRIYAANRHLLDGLPAATRRHVFRRYHQWMAGFARQAGHASLHDASRPFLRRRLRAAARFLFVARYAPDTVTLGDFYCLFLPARAAEHWI